MSKTALVTGITGQDGNYLTELLLKNGYKVWGMVRRCSHSDSIERLKSIVGDNVSLRYGDLTDSVSIRNIIKESQPDEVYNLGAQSHVRISFDIPEYTSKVNAAGVLSILRAVKDIVPEAKFYQASTSEMFGKCPPPQNEKSPFEPCSPYGAAKLQAYWEVVNAREGLNLFTCNGILFNHESERRGENFVTRKITSGIAKIIHGLQDKISLGNLDAERDWGHAQDYVRAMHLMLQHNFPDDYVVATGKTWTVRQFLESALECAEIRYERINEDPLKPWEEKYLWNGKVIVDIDQRFYRPVEVNYLCGDASKAKRILNWEPQIDFYELVSRMIHCDLKMFK